MAWLKLLLVFWLVLAFSAPVVAAIGEFVSVKQGAKVTTGGATRSSRIGSWYARFGKRILDVVFVVIAAPIVVPTVFIIWMIVRLDGGSGFFSQERVGRNGVTFRCWKIRSMVPNSQEKLREILESNSALRSEWEENQKLVGDPRITCVGRVLRKTSLDEFPQFWNVLKGDMSLVGPRPVLPSELEKYGQDARWYKFVRPGITGAWQVSGRNQLSYEERVSIDVDYASSFDLINDLRIIVLTVREVLVRSGC